MSVPQQNLTVTGSVEHWVVPNVQREQHYEDYYCYHGSMFYNFPVLNGNNALETAEDLNFRTWIVAKLINALQNCSSEKLPSYVLISDNGRICK